MQSTVVFFIDLVAWRRAATLERRLWSTPKGSLAARAAAIPK